MQAASKPRSPLAGLVVLDLTRVRAGPTAVKQLSDWGANVIKIEAPDQDDMTGPRDGADFQNLQRGKRSLVIDLKKPEGIAVLKRLAAGADVLVENFRPDVKHRLGIDYESLRPINPRLIYASISGFGQTGLYRNRPGFDQVIQGMAGLMSVTGNPDGEPLRAGIPVADLASGLFAAIGILVALVDRANSGEGQWVQTSLLQAQIAMLDLHAASWLIDGKIPQRTGNNHPYMTPMGVYPAADGDIVIGTGGEEQYGKFCKALDAPELLDDPRFLTVATRAANRAAFTEAVTAYTRAQPSAVWVERFNAVGVACGPINTIDKAFADPQVQALGVTQSVRHPRRGELKLVATPIALSASDPTVGKCAPDKGADTEDVLREFGYSADEVDELRRSGIAVQGICARVKGGVDP